MGINVHIRKLPQIQFLQYTCQGEVKLDEVREVYLKSLELEGFTKNMPAVWNLKSNQITTNIKCSELPSLLYFLENQKKDRGYNAKAAILVKKEPTLVYGLCRALENQNTNLNLQLFSTLDEALEWFSSTEQMEINKEEFCPIY